MSAKITFFRKYYTYELQYSVEQKMSRVNYERCL